MDKTKCEKQWVKYIGSVTRFASEEDATKSKQEYVAACLNKKAEPKGIFKNPQVQKGIKNVQNTFRNPFAEGFKKYVVIKDFTSKKASGEEKKFKVGMNLFAREISSTSGSPFENYGDIRPQVMWSGLISYAGYEIPKDNVKLKNPNIYERIQSFFTIKKGF